MISPSRKSYVGQSTNLQKRLQGYQNCAGMQNQRKLLHAVKKYGMDSFVIEVLEEIDISSMTKWEALHELLLREAAWIEKFDSVENGYNCMSYGSHVLIDSDTLRRRGVAISIAKLNHFSSDAGQEYKEKLRKANLGKSPPNKGKPMSDEQKKKISDARRGQKMKPMTEERKKAMSEIAKAREKNRIEPHPNKGQKLTTEQREKLSKALKGKSKTQEWIIKISESNRKTWKERRSKRHIELVTSEECRLPIFRIDEQCHHICNSPAQPNDPLPSILEVSFIFDN